LVPDLGSNPFLEKTHLEFGCHIEQIDHRTTVGATEKGGIR